MPYRKGDPPDLVTIKVRIPEGLKAECLKTRDSGLHKGEAESTFIRYLLEIGLKKYQKVILPAELSDDEQLITQEKTPDYGGLEKKRKKAV